MARKPVGGKSMADSAQLALADVLERTRSGSYFECLRIPNDAPTSQVKNAWARINMEMDALRGAHPWDSDQILAIEEAQQILNDAFSVLSDPDLRLSYRRALEL